MAETQTENIVREKLAQAVEILEEEGIDIWMLVARESDVMGDPSMPLVVGTSVTWESAFLISRTGDHVAIVGTGDVANVLQTGAWDNVVGYVEGITQPLIAELEKRDPNAIVLNYSTDNNMADGITHGMYLLLEEQLKDTPYWARVASAGEIPTKVRARKSPTELARIRTAVRTTERIWEATQAWLRPGLTEFEVSNFMHEQLEERRIGSSWDWKYCPTITAGPDSPRGHVGPTDIKTRAGELVTIDFGVNEDEYSSDMQRTYYFLKPGETDAPDEVKRHFAIIDRCIQDAAAFIKPGVARLGGRRRRPAHLRRRGIGGVAVRARASDGPRVSRRWDRARSALGTLRAATVWRGREGRGLHAGDRLSRAWLRLRQPGGGHRRHRGWLRVSRPTAARSHRPRRVVANDSHFMCRQAARCAMVAPSPLWRRILTTI